MTNTKKATRDPRSAESGSNADAVRGGYAFVRQSMQSTRCYHVIHVEGFQRMYLCGCGKPIRGVEGWNKNRLGPKARKDWRFGDDFRYR